MADPRQRTLTVGTSCVLHAGLIAVILFAGHWLRPTLAEKLPILPVELVTSAEEPKREVAPPPPPPPKRSPPPVRPPRPIEPPPKVVETPPPPPPPEPIRVATEPPPAPAPAPTLAPPPAQAVAAAAPSAPAAAAAPSAPAIAPSQGGLDLRTPAPSAPARVSTSASRAPATAAVAPAPSGPPPSATAGITRTARPSGGYQVRPTYPPTARQAGIQGTTLLRVQVLIDGSVGEVRVQESAGHPDLDEAAADAVRRWRFEPARKGQDPVAMWVLLPVEFRLK